MGRLDKVLRMRVSLPPFEIYCLFQEDNLFLNLSSETLIYLHREGIKKKQIKYKKEGK